MTHQDKLSYIWQLLTQAFQHSAALPPTCMYRARKIPLGAQSAILMSLAVWGMQNISGVSPLWMPLGLTTG